MDTSGVSSRCRLISGANTVISGSLIELAFRNSLGGGSGGGSSYSFYLFIFLDQR